MKREIKAHKGGRTKGIKFDVTDAEKAIIDKARGGLSYADYVVKVSKEKLGIKESPSL